MENHNSSIILKCLAGNLPCIYGIVAIKRELKKNNLVKICKSCNKKFIIRAIPTNLNYNCDCDNCERLIGLIESSENKSLENKSFVDNNNIINQDNKNYLRGLLPELLLLIIDELSDYDTINFSIAIRKCDITTFKKIARPRNTKYIGCWGCDKLSFKYFNCFECAKGLCANCVIKCELCDNIIKNPQNGSYKYLCDGDGSCTDEWSTCSDSHLYLEYFKKHVAKKNKYGWGFGCQKCKKYVCRNCFNYDYSCIECKKINDHRV